MSQGPVTVLTASLHGKVALITGAGRGIGRGCAIELGRRGASVVVNYANSKESADEVVKLIEETGTGAKAISIQADVSKPAEIERLFQESKKHFGKIDIVMSNSGTESWDKTEEITEEKYDHVFNLNARAQFFVGQAAWKHLEDNGRLILMSSIAAGLLGVRDHALYNASKMAVIGMIKAFATDFGRRGITVNGVAPGGIKSDMFTQNAWHYIPGGTPDIPAATIEKMMAEHCPLGRNTRWEAMQVVRSHDGMLGLNHFRLLRRLGCGDIGSVYLSELTGTKTYFAMKVMDKAALASRKKLLRAQTEREILQSLDHPFLPTLYTHFETEKFSCLVMEFCPGGDLHALRQRQPGKFFPEHAARFYVAEVLLALEYLHMLGIIYRDLKPENVLVRDDGHIMLSDFDLSLRCAVSPTLVKSSNSGLEAKSSGYCAQPACIEPTCIMQPDCIQPACFTPRFLSRHRKEKKSKPKSEVYHQVSPLPELIAEPTSARSMSFVGTHEYLAPEIIKGEGHGSAVDWWTFGIFLYELLFGRTPFKGAGNRATLFNVVGQPLRFPESPSVSFAARDLIRGLLVKEPQHRLAYRRGATEIKQHPFFQSVNWALIRCANPPEVPRVDVIDFSSRMETPHAPAGEKMPGVDVKPSGNYLEIDFF